jgi:exonuclease 3'-5' domain-containing protein 1
MLDNILEWRTTGVSLFADLEGKDLGSYDGDVRLMSIYHKLSRHTYLVGVSELGEAAFNTKSKDNLSLRDILESRSIVKGFWDARNDAAGLYREFGIKLNSSGVIDIQLVICKAKSFKHELNRPRLDKAIRMFCNISNEISSRMHNTKTAGKRMWNPATGGSFAVFSERPLSPLITAYCINDTYFLEEWLEYGMAGLSRDDFDRVKKICARQLSEVVLPGYVHGGGGKAINPFVVYGVDSDEYDD